MMFGILKGLQAKIILILGITVPILGYALYYQIQKNGALEQQTDQLIADLESASNQLREWQEQEELASAIVLNTHDRIRTITETRTETRWKIREIVKEIERENPSACVGMPVPDPIKRMFRETGSNRSGGTEDVSPDSSDPMD